MLRKLLRYEFKSYFRIMPALYLALAVLSIIGGIHYGSSPVRRDSWLAILSGCLLVAIFTVNLVLVFQRYRDNLLKDEGYLMFTLPVSLWSLAASKAITALCMFLLSAAAALASGFIYAIFIDFGGLIEGISRLWDLWVYQVTAYRIATLITCIIIALIFIIQQLCLVYAVMTASQLLPRFRGIAGFGAYLLVMGLEERCMNLLAPQGYAGEMLLPGLLALGGLMAAFAALYFWLCGWLLKRTLNLE